MKTSLLKTKTQMKIKVFLLTLVVIFSVFCVNSCKKEEVKDREYNEAEVIEAAKNLIKKSEKINDIFYGSGIACDFSDTNNANGNYYPAEILSCEKFGVNNVEDIKRLTKECFTKSQSEYMIKNTLGSITDSNGDVIYFARYYQEYDSLNRNEEKCIMVYSKYEPFLIDTVEYLYDTLKVFDVEGEIITVEIEVKVTSKSGNVQQKKIKVNLLEEENGFRLDSPTYARNNQIQE